MLPRMRVEQPCGPCQHLQWSHFVALPLGPTASISKASEPRDRAVTARWNLTAGRVLHANVSPVGQGFLIGDWGGPVMTDWPVVGFTLLGLTCWFGFLYLLLYLLSFSASMPL
jgi:hypothetical protein